MVFMETNTNRIVDEKRAEVNLILLHLIINLITKLAIYFAYHCQ